MYVIPDYAESTNTAVLEMDYYAHKMQKLKSARKHDGQTLNRGDELEGVGGMLLAWDAQGVKCFFRGVHQEEGECFL